MVGHIPLEDVILVRVQVSQLETKFIDVRRSAGSTSSWTRKTERDGASRGRVNFQQKIICDLAKSSSSILIEREMYSWSKSRSKIFNIIHIWKKI